MRKFISAVTKHTGLIVPIILIGLILIAGCVPVKDAYTNYTARVKNPYFTVLERWTTEAKVYDGLKTILITKGTFKSLEFREAYVEKYARDYKLDEKVKTRMISEETLLAEKSVEFILSVYAADDKKLRLESSQSLWKVYLLAGQEKIVPYEVRNIKKERARLEEFYPYISPWASIYRIRFRADAIPAQAGKFDLLLAGVMGKAILSFDLKGQKVKKVDDKK